MCREFIILINSDVFNNLLILYIHGECKRRNGIAEWHAEWPAERHAEWPAEWIPERKMM
jgi:hypothetical protein